MFKKKGQEYKVHPDVSQEIKSVKGNVVVKKSTFLEGELGVIANKSFQSGELLFTINGPIISSRTKHSFQVGPSAHIQPLTGADGKPGLGYYLNHSCDPNVYIRIIRDNEGYSIQVIAHKEIKEAEEVKVDYATVEFKTTVSQLPCKCGYTQCRGYINGFKDLSAQKKAYYISKGLIPSHLLELDK